MYQSNIFVQSQWCTPLYIDSTLQFTSRSMVTDLLFMHSGVLRLSDWLCC